MLAPARIELPGVAPENNELGVMLPYTPLHHLLFAAGAPDVLVMTSANRSSEPIAYEDEDALQRLAGIADSFLIGQRPIARRVDDSVARVGAFGPVILRRARGYAPGAVASLPAERPILALGADLKNSITLVVDGQAFVSQHIGDLDHYQSLRAFQETIEDLVSMYEVRRDELLLVHDLHPQYFSTIHGATLGVPRTLRGAASSRPRRICPRRTRRMGEASHRRELRRHRIRQTMERSGAARFSWAACKMDLRAWLTCGVRLWPVAMLPRIYPVQAAAGFLAQVEGLPDCLPLPSRFPTRYRGAYGVGAQERPHIYHDLCGPSI